MRIGRIIYNLSAHRHLLGICKPLFNDCNYYENEIIIYLKKAYYIAGENHRYWLSQKSILDLRHYPGSGVIGWK
jgi:hypothetical protein